MVVAVVVASIAYLVGCSSGQTVTQDPGVSQYGQTAPQAQQQITYQNIDAAQAKQLIDSDKNVQIIDVREEYEFAGGYIPGAKLIPIGQFTARMNEIDREKPVLVYCASGSRSPSAAEVLVQSGYTQVYHFPQGIAQWPYDIQR